MGFFDSPTVKAFLGALSTMIVILLVSDPPDGVAGIAGVILYWQMLIYYTGLERDRREAYAVTHDER